MVYVGILSSRSLSVENEVVGLLVHHKMALPLMCVAGRKEEEIRKRERSPCPHEMTRGAVRMLFLDLKSPTAAQLRASAKI